MKKNCNTCEYGAENTYCNKHYRWNPNMDNEWGDILYCDDFLKRKPKPKVIEKKADKIVHLGCMNGWDFTPEIVNNCKHKVEINNESKSLTIYTCDICGFTYSVDSGG